jgi:glutamate/tyrosine decarboxylase-like PLP-dependent enzyme
MKAKIPSPLDDRGSEAIGAWFLGPVGENVEAFRSVVNRAITTHFEARRSAYDDPAWITAQVMESEAYNRAFEILETELEHLSKELVDSVPFFSYRYQGHMLWDVTLPGVVGYLMAMLYNQNNVAAEASPVTTKLEMQVADSLCEMLGYDPKTSWGHITCGGTVANMEALWAARNVKVYAQAVASALKREPALAAAAGIAVERADGTSSRLLDLDPWALLNLKADDVLDLPRRMKEDYQIADEALESIKSYTVQRLGIAGFLRDNPDSGLDRLVVVGPATRHYSLPKGASLLGLGEDSFIPVPVDVDARISLPALRATLDHLLAERRPVAAVVAVLGTTEESAVDPLAHIVDLREEYRQLGFDFLIHVDAAWGGYFASLLRDAHGETTTQQMTEQARADNYSDWLMLANTKELLGQSLARERGEELAGEELPHEDRQARVFTPQTAMSPYVETQYRALPEADSITVDPHKAGYIPYPAGALCYRNVGMPNVVAFTDHVILHAPDEPTVGIFGIEGSKPGAAAVAAWVSHRVIRPDRSGYGRILGRCMFNSTRLYAAMVTMAQKSDPFIIRTLQRLPAERAGKEPEEVEDELGRIRNLAAFDENLDLCRHLAANEADADLFRALGPDLIITAYAFNFKRADGQLNDDLGLANDLNRRIFQRLSTTAAAEAARDGRKRPPIIITSSKFDSKRYGVDFVETFMRRLGLRGSPNTPVDFLISTTMDPFLTDTSGDPPTMIPTLINGLRDTVVAAISDVPGV